MKSIKLISYIFIFLLSSPMAMAEITPISNEKKLAAEIDVESLGLDNLDKKTPEKEAEKITPQNNKKEQ